MEYELDMSNYGGIMRKILYIFIGCISLGLGIIGNKYLYRFIISK